MTTNQLIAQYSRREDEREGIKFGRNSITIGEVTIEWNDPPIPWPTYIYTGWEPAFPILMVPSGRGNPLIFNNDDKQTYYPQMPPLFWYAVMNGVTTHLVGEAWRANNGLVETAIITFWNQTHGPDEQIQIEAGIWLINDYYTDINSNAADRAYKLAQLPKQPQGILVPKLYQANSKESFNTYFRQYQDEGFTSVICRPLDHLLGEPQHVVSKLL